jgi:hypothetical protein
MIFFIFFVGLIKINLYPDKSHPCKAFFLFSRISTKLKVSILSSVNDL